MKKGISLITIHCDVLLFEMGLLDGLWKWRGRVGMEYYEQQEGC